MDDELDRIDGNRVWPGHKKGQFILELDGQAAHVDMIRIIQERCIDFGEYSNRKFWKTPSEKAMQVLAYCPGYRQRKHRRCVIGAGAHYNTLDKINKPYWNILSKVRTGKRKA